MLHTRFRGNRHAGSREENFWRVFTIYGRGRPSWSCDPECPGTNFRSPYPRRLHKNFYFDRPSGSEKKIFEIVDADAYRGYIVFKDIYFESVRHITININSEELLRSFCFFCFDVCLYVCMYVCMYVNFVFCQIFLWTILHMTSCTVYKRISHILLISPFLSIFLSF